MDNTWKTIDSWITRINKGFTAISAVCIFFMMVIVIADIIGAKFFNHPIPMGIYIIQDLDVLVVFFAIGYVALSIGHMNVLVFDKLMSRAANKVIALIALFLSFLTSSLMTWFAVALVRGHILDGDLESSIQGFYLWPFSMSMLIGMILMTLAFGVAFVRELVKK